MDNNYDRYRNVHTPFLAVDCIIFGFDDRKLKLLLFRRKVKPLEDNWSLIGSFVKEEESVQEAALRILEDSTGLNGIYLQELKSFSDPNRDPGGRVISIAHYALINILHQQHGLRETYQAKWFDMEDLPDLILDHDEMVQTALGKLRQNAKHFPIGIELLPAKFTIPQLQQFYESLFQKNLDRRNFRKKILGFKVFEKLDEKDMSTSKKGAYLYRVNDQKYSELQDSITDV